MWSKLVGPKRNLSQAVCVDDDLRRRSTLPKIQYINFTIHQAHNGQIIETEIYDAEHDHFNRNMYLVTGEQDLAQEISRIFLLENIKR